MAQGRPEVWLEFDLKEGLITIGNIYREHGRAETGTTDLGLLEAVADNLVDLAEKGQKIIAAGDYNIDIMAGRLNYAKLFKKRMVEAGYEIQGFGTTFYRMVKGKEWASDLDWVLGSSVEISNTWKEENSSSDHHIIGWSLDMGSNKSSKSKKSVKNMKKLLEKKFEFLQSLLKHPWEDLPFHDLEKQASLICTRLVESLNEVVPLQVMRSKGNSCPIPSKELKKLRRERDNARKQKKCQKVQASTKQGCHTCQTRKAKCC